MKISKNVSEGEFILKDILYHVTYPSLCAHYQDMELVLFPEVEAEKKKKKVEYEMSSVRLYHNNGFHTHTSDFKSLQGKKFVWKNEYNRDEEEAGTLYVQEHEAVREGTIEIQKVENGQMTIKWSGRADVGWSRKYGSKVPFETVFTAKIPASVPYILDASKSVRMTIDDKTALEILNLEEFNEEVMRVSESRVWDSFHTVLKFRLIHAKEEYPGEVLFTNGKNNFELKMEKACPKKVEFKGVDYNLRVNYEVFRFEIS